MEKNTRFATSTLEKYTWLLNLVCQHFLVRNPNQMLLMDLLMTPKNPIRRPRDLQLVKLEMLWIILKCWRKSQGLHWWDWSEHYCYSFCLITICYQITSRWLLLFLWIPFSKIWLWGFGVLKREGCVLQVWTTFWLF